MNGLGELFADKLKLARKVRVAPQRRLDALTVAAAQRAGHIPRQQRLDLGRFDGVVRHVV